MTSLWQNLTDQVFVKITVGRTGFSEAFIEDTDEIWSGIVGSYGLGIDEGGGLDSGNNPSQVSLAIKFTPNIP
jgi:hypothetical protein